MLIVQRRARRIGRLLHPPLPRLWCGRAFGGSVPSPGGPAVGVHSWLRLLGLKLLISR